MADFGDTLAAEFLAGGPLPPTEQAPITVMLNGNAVVTYVTGGVRYAAIGATQADAQALLSTYPLECIVT